MSIPSELGDLLQTATPHDRPTQDEMLKILRYAVSALGEALRCEIACDNWHEDVRPGYIRAWIYSANPALGLASTWRGIIVCHLLSDTPGIQIGATLFLYSKRQQLLIRSGESFLDLHCDYVREQRELCWNLDGWFRDEYQEYPEFNNDR